ncbi:hypothetical protein OFO01_01800 [Campylobacter sp. JMF_01 NE2]|uniref:hypothetical protein n=1 Tax=unclassified Campylobacter TaxID=2593542 RepID=UPI0022E9FCB5|nr:MULTISPECIES: hypothetical protein [unclassified Campylobacter]MDA3052188.1 hypothetical protein [Campylobacter sp. JMF_03 NE3]MDA3066522.1 hypothetical protein [Campylobacter sp. JMF_01 NE2]
MRKFLVLAGLLVLLAGCGEEKKRGKQRLANTKKNDSIELEISREFDKIAAANSATPTKPINYTTLTMPNTPATFDASKDGLGEIVSAPKTLEAPNFAQEKSAPSVSNEPNTKNLAPSVPEMAEAPAVSTQTIIVSIPNQNKNAQENADKCQNAETIALIKASKKDLPYKNGVVIYNDITCQNNLLTHYYEFDLPPEAMEKISQIEDKLRSNLVLKSGELLELYCKAEELAEYRDNEIAMEWRYTLPGIDTNLTSIAISPSDCK